MSFTLYRFPMTQHPSWRIKNLAKFIDLICSFLIIPWWINIYRFLHHKPTIGLKLFWLKIKSSLEEPNLSFKQSLRRNITHPPFLLSWFYLILTVLLVFVFIARVIQDELWLWMISFIFFIVGLFTFILLFCSGLYRFFGLSFSEEKSKTEIVYDK